MTEVLFSERARRDWNRLDRSVQSQIRKKLAFIAASENPLKYAEKLHDVSLGDYRFRVGDYCLIFDVRGHELIVLRVGHRKDIYKK